MPTLRIKGSDREYVFPDGMSQDDMIAAIYEQFPILDPNYAIERQERALNDLKVSLEKAMQAIKPSVTVEPPDLTELTAILQAAMQARTQVSEFKPDFEPLISALMAEKEVHIKVKSRDRYGLIDDAIMSIR